MIGAGTFINPLIKIVTTVAILAAAYFFIVKPALDTTEEVSSNFSDSFGESFSGFEKLQPGIQKSVKQAQKLQEQSAQTSSAQLKEANKLLDCITDASGNASKIQACNSRFSP